ncbi:MAG: Fic/DOC family N-terminal domain-containing protein, partial [Thermoleophilia bacterium]
MSEVLRRRWQGGLGGSGLPRRETKPCDYEVYVPDRLGERGFSLSAEVAADVSDAEAAIARLNVDANALVNTEAMARILLRAEAVASSRIEGLVVGARRLLRAEALRESTTGVGDVTANEVLNNIDAMVFAVNSVHRGDPITVELL